MLKLSIAGLAILMASAVLPVKEVKLERVDENAVKPGAELTLKATVTLTHEACDEAADKTSFFAKGAEITERGKWQRIDKFSLYSILKVRVKDDPEAVITLQLIKHTQKSIEQVKLTVDN